MTYKVHKEILAFGDIEIKKHKFYLYKNLAPLNDVDFEDVLVSKKIFSGRKSYNTLLVTCTMIIMLSHFR